MKWLLLILSLPTQNTTARMRTWRALKASGAAVLRDGVYLLPHTPRHQQTLQALEQDVTETGGTAYVLALDHAEPNRFEALFDRNEDYRQLAQDIQQILTSETTLSSTELSKQNKKLRNVFNTISDTDFFPGESRKQTLALLDQLQTRLDAQTNPNEPNALPGGIERLTIQDYQQRRWATRQRPWVDRLTSAWLIRRFIDPKASMLWLQHPADCPADALGFDFDGARFSHIENATGTLVTFETLMYSFGLDSDPALKRFGQIVHALDVGGLPVAETSGLEHVLRGMRKRIQNDDELLKHAEHIFNDFYASLQETQA
jgi:hypothetical protein